MNKNQCDKIILLIFFNQMELFHLFFFASRRDYFTIFFRTRRLFVSIIHKKWSCKIFLLQIVFAFFFLHHLRAFARSVRALRPAVDAKHLRRHAGHLQFQCVV